MGITLELLLKSCICIVGISCLLWWVESWIIKCFFAMGGKSEHQNSFLLPFAHMVKILSQNNIHHLKNKIVPLGITAFCCFLISFLPFIVFPFCEPIDWNGRPFYVEYLHSSMGGLFIPFVSVFGPIVLYSLASEKMSFSSEIAIIRHLINFFSAKGASLLILLSLFLVYDSFDLHAIVKYQKYYLIGYLPAYGIFIQPIAGILFFVCIQMEANVGSFNFLASKGDVAIGHYNHLTGMKFLLLKFFEKSQWLSLTIFYVFIFLGGYAPLPGLEHVIELFPWMSHLVQICSLVLKIMLVVCLSSWIKRFWPNYRTVDIICLVFKKIVLVAFANFLVTVGYMYYKQ